MEVKIVISVRIIRLYDNKIFAILYADITYFVYMNSL